MKARHGVRGCDARDLLRRRGPKASESPEVPGLGERSKRVTEILSQTKQKQGLTAGTVL